jgi:hypothetical protein
MFAYYAALNLLDARVLFSKMKVSELLDPAAHAKKEAIERHHLFPKKYLKGIGISETRDTNQIGNYALVEWTDSIAISDKAPAVYLPKYLPGSARRKFGKCITGTLCRTAGSSWTISTSSWSEGNGSPR